MDADEPPLRIVLELESQERAISGLLRSDGHADERFWGWLELLAALEALRAGARRE